MRISTSPPLGQVQAPQGAPVSAPRADRSRATFALPTETARETKRADGTKPAATAAGLETLLAVQGLQPDDRRERRRRAVKRGHDSLHLLDALKLALLAGEQEPATLLKLRGLTAAKLEETGEAGLDGVLAEIDLRAQVELAKREATLAA